MVTGKRVGEQVAIEGLMALGSDLDGRGVFQSENAGKFTDVACCGYSVKHLLHNTTFLSGEKLRKS